MVKVQKQKKFQRNEQLYINMAKNNHGLIFNHFGRKWKAKKSYRYILQKKLPKEQ